MIDGKVDEGDGGVEVVNVDSFSDVLVRHPIPAPRSSLGVPDESKVPTPVPRRSKRQTAGKHSNPNNLPKSVCNAVSFSPDILSQVLAGMVIYTSEKLKGAMDS